MSPNGSPIHQNVARIIPIHSLLIHSSLSGTIQRPLLNQERLGVPLHKYDGYFEKDVIPLSVFGMLRECSNCEIRLLKKLLPPRMMVKAWKTLMVLTMKCFLFHGRKKDIIFA